MSITYEEALSTLESMFGESWTRDQLDVVLRNQKGHMENTCDLILRHGEGDPQVLVDQLQAGIDPEAQARAMDERLARQLAQGQQTTTSTSRSPSSSARKGRGTPITLPDDFLRIPGRPITAATTTTTTQSQLMDDEALARMLQDELFTEELARNPDFAHLARGGGSGRATNRSSATARAGLPSQQRPAFLNAAPPNLNNITEKISELGDNARRRLQLLAAQFNAKNSSSEGGTASSPGAQAERRGLLDDNDDLELAARKDL